MNPAPLRCVIRQRRAGLASLRVAAAVGVAMVLVVADAASRRPPGRVRSPAVLFEEPFDDGGLGKRGWYDNTALELVDDQHAPGSRRSARFHFAAGAKTPASGGAARHKFAPTSSVYVSYWVKYSDNWVGSGKAYHPHEFYLMSTMDGDYDGPSSNWLTVYIEQNYQDGGRPRLAMQDNKAINTSFGSPPFSLVGVTEHRSTGGCNGVAERDIRTECFNGGGWYNLKELSGPVTFMPRAGDGYKGNWNHVEAFVRLNSVTDGEGRADGVMQYWFNGHLVIDRRDIVFRTADRAGLQFAQFIIGPYIGDGSPVDQSFWLDHLVVATGRTADKDAGSSSSASLPK